MRHGLIGQCYALMWAPCAACPLRCPELWVSDCNGDLDFFEQL